MSTRATHLELAGGLSTENFILALTRFICRQCHPKQIRNGKSTNFVGAERELRDTLKNINKDKVKYVLNENDINWKFNPPSSLWMDSAMELLVNITKKNLKTIMADRTVNNQLFGEMRKITFLTEVKSIVNSVPLTASTDHIQDAIPFTSNHFLIRQSSPRDQFVNVSKKIVNSRTKWKAAQAMTSLIWKRWIREYLPLFTCRKKWAANIRHFGLGDLVIIVKKEVKRSKWPLGRVLEIYKSKDIVRSIKVKSSTTELIKPDAKLCLLEKSK